MTNYSPNKRIEQARKDGDVIRTTTTVPKGMAPEVRVPMPRPMPGIIILVHGVNDIGEAYATQARGLCEGLNIRLGRKDLAPGDWDIPKACKDNRVASYSRRADAQGYNPIPKGLPVNLFLADRPQAGPTVITCSFSSPADHAQA